MDVEAAAQRSIPVTITPLANFVSVAEHAIFMLLALAKNARENYTAVREGRFESARVSMKPLDLAGRHLLIIGFGRTGSRVAPRALGFGMHVHAYGPYVDTRRYCQGARQPVHAPETCERVRVGLQVRLLTE